MNTFEVGQIVVCIAKGEWSRSKAEFPEYKYPVRGCVYTIRDVYADTNLGTPVIGIRLQEIVNPADYKGSKLEVGWLASEFRPVKKTDISVFKKMLEPTPPTKKMAYYANLLFMPYYNGQKK